MPVVLPPQRQHILKQPPQLAIATISPKFLIVSPAPRASVLPRSIGMQAKR